jgi:membrane protease YdiL (CAAX protease family)
VVGVVAQSLTFLIPQPGNPTLPGVIVAPTARLVIGGLVANGVWVSAGWRSWGDLGWFPPTRSLKAFGIGLGVGLAMAATVLLLEVLAGARIELTDESMRAYVSGALMLLGVLAVAALSEELLFRGLPLVRLADTLGPAGASILLAVVFAAFHASNPGWTILGLINVAVASLALSAIFFRLGGMPGAWAAHLGWNAGLGIMADAPVSGLSFQLPGVEYSTQGPAWVTGGPFGPEGGVIATVVLVATAVLVSVTRIPSLSVMPSSSREV